MKISLDLMLIEKGEFGYQTHDLWSGNVTHNLVPMWQKAGVYEALYKNDGKKAKDVLAVVEQGYKDMLKNKETYVALNPENGWGDFDGALKFIREFYEACVQYPESIISVYA